VAALVVGVMPLVAWSGGCSSSVTSPNTGRGGGGGAAGTGMGGTTGQAGSGGGAGQGGTGGQGGSGNPDGGAMCCALSGPGPQARCLDGRQLMKCDIAGADGCRAPSGYSYVMTVVDCPNGCVPPEGGVGNGSCL